MLLETPWPVDREIPEWTWDPPSGTVVVSADDHVIEPDLWVERVPSRFRDRAPRVHRDEFGFHIAAEGRSLDAPGFNSLLVEGRPGMADLDKRLADMTAERVHASVLYSQRAIALFAQLSDKELLYHCLDAYNEWLAELQQQAAGRIIGVPILPTPYAPEGTREYLQKLDTLGFRAVQLPSYPKDIRYNASALDTMWDALEESGLPVSFHIGASTAGRGRGALGAAVTAALQPFRELWCNLVFSGTLERHPDLRVVFTEGGISWAPAALFDADKQYKAFGRQLRPRLSELPSFYWSRQCYATFMNDPAGVKLVDEIGYEHMLWSIDYPHPEGNLGESAEVMRSLFESLGNERAQAVVGGNAVKLWGLDAKALVQTCGF